MSDICCGVQRKQETNERIGLDDSVTRRRRRLLLNLAHTLD